MTAQDFLCKAAPIRRLLALKRRCDYRFRDSPRLAIGMTYQSPSRLTNDRSSPEILFAMRANCRKASAPYRSGQSFSDFKPFAESCSNVYAVFMSATDTGLWKAFFSTCRSPVTVPL